MGVKVISTASVRFSRRDTRDRYLVCINQLAADCDHDGADTWRRITAAVIQLASTTPPEPLH
jgi:hypothetical protein